MNFGGRLRICTLLEQTTLVSPECAHTDTLRVLLETLQHAHNFYLTFVLGAPMDIK